MCVPGGAKLVQRVVNAESITGSSSSDSSGPDRIWLIQAGCSIERHTSDDKRVAKRANDKRFEGAESDF
jgi:hypothetical protein